MRKPSYFETVVASYDDSYDSYDFYDYAEFAAMCDDSDWTDEDVADWEEQRREKLAEVNEY